MSENTNKTPRVTKANRFEDIIALLNGDAVKYGTDTPTAVAFIEHEMELLAKKNSGEGKKETKAQQENNALKERIVEFLADKPDGMTCSQLIKAIPGFADYSPQKVAPLCNALVKDGRLVKVDAKGGKTLFKLA